MSEPLWLVGADSFHEAWQKGATHDIAPLGPLERARGAPWAIEASSGPLQEKRRRLQLLEELGVQTVLTASTTATLTAQRTWLKGSMRLIGCDPLLMTAGGRVQSLVQASDNDLGWLATLWPERAFVAAADAIGLVFSREILPIINEAVDFLSKGTAAEEIDQGVCLGLNYPRGPIAWARLFGWSQVFWGLRALQDMYGGRFSPHPWIRAQLGGSLLDGLD